MRLIRSKAVFFVILISLVIVLSYKGGYAEMSLQAVNFSKTVGLWTRTDGVQIVEAGNIFEYMDGAGELYLAYRFEHLEVFEYTSEEHDDILVELYVMGTSDDAFGLFSLDWEGDPVTFDSVPAESFVALPHRALYGGGWLRMCAGRIYARIMTYLETPESRDAVLAFGQMIAENRAMSAEPKLLRKFPLNMQADWTIRQERIGFFRSYSVLNSLYYLSHQNLLNLDHSTEAVFAPYQRQIDAETTQQIQVVLVRYASPEKAQAASEQFHTAYFPELPQGEHDEKTSTFQQLEDGWGGYRVKNACLTLAFEAPDQETARMFLEQVSCSK